MLDRRAEVAIIIVGFRNASDIEACLSALSISSFTPDFDVFVSENGGQLSYQHLVQRLIDPQGPCNVTERDDVSEKLKGNQFVEVRQLEFKARPSRVFIGCSPDNLGYAGGINIWLQRLLNIDGWNGVWILNPDTEPEPTALNALVERAEKGKKAMVGSTIF